VILLHAQGMTRKKSILLLLAALSTSPVLLAQQAAQTQGTPAAQSNQAQAVQPQLTPEQVQLLMRLLQTQQNPGQVTPAPQPQIQQPHQPGQPSPANPKAQSECIQSGAQSSLTKTTIVRSSRIPHPLWKPLGKICDKTGLCIDQNTLVSAQADAARAEQEKKNAAYKACIEAVAAAKAAATPPMPTAPAATKQ
jgi:hypothetical protein